MKLASKLDAWPGPGQLSSTPSAVASRPFTPERFLPGPHWAIDTVLTLAVYRVARVGQRRPARFLQRTANHDAASTLRPPRHRVSDHAGCDLAGNIPGTGGGGLQRGRNRQPGPSSLPPDRSMIPPCFVSAEERNGHRQMVWSPMSRVWLPFIPSK